MNVLHQFNQRLATGRSLLRPTSDLVPPRPLCWGAPRASAKESNGNTDEDYVWSQLAFPSYMQSREKHKKDVCRDFDRAINAAERKQAHELFGSPSENELDDEPEEEDSVWLSIRREAERDAAAEPILSSFLYATILAHDSFERALAFVLSNRLANAVMLPTQLFETFYEVLISHPDVREGALADVEACRERDPACISYSQALLYYKGYHAIQTHRIAHALWSRGQKVMAVALQSRMSEVLAVDIHPAARLGHGILLDHGTGVVIGETAVIGNNVSLLQNVTLGGTGKEHGDRHPKISDNVLIGASATVLGNIRVGEGAQIAAGSLVLKPVAPHTMVAGSPAKPVGTVTGNPAEKMQQWNKKLLSYDPFCDNEQAAVPETATAAPAAPKAVKPGKLDVAASEAAWDAVASNCLQPMDAGESSSSSRIKVPKDVNMHSNGKHHPVATNGTKPAAAAAAAAAPAAAMPAPAAPAPAAPAPAQHDKGHQNSKQHGKHHSKAPEHKKQQQQQRQQQPHAASSDAQAHQHQPPQQHWQPSEAQQYVFEQATGHHLEPLEEAEQRQHQAERQQQAEQQQQQQQDVVQPAAAVAQQDTGEASVHPKQQAVELRGIHEGEVEATIDEAVAAKKWADRKEEPEYVI